MNSGHRFRSVGRVLAVGLAVAALLAGGTPAAAALPTTLVEDGFSSPLYVTNAGDSRLFVVEKGGLIKIVGGGTFLDVSTKIDDEGERGLLGLAFDPNYASNGLFYIQYNRTDGDLVLAEHRVSSVDPDVADAVYERPVLMIEHSSATNHNGGWIAFNNGKLFISVGDGGDTPETAQDLNALTGKILRIDPHDPDGNGPLSYSIPNKNPFVNKPGRDEILAFGFRNPWRCSHDRQTGVMFCGDVGQNTYEEIDRGPMNGHNYGWKLLEGFHYYQYGNHPMGQVCSNKCKTRPIAEYAHSVPGDNNSAVTGGYVSRRSGAALFGKYVFGDLGSGRVWAISANFQSGTALPAPLAQTAFTISSFGEGADGRLYVVDLGGGVYRLNDS